MREITCIVEGKGISKKTEEVRGYWSKERKDRVVRVGGEGRLRISFLGIYFKEVNQGRAGEAQCTKMFQ